MNQTYVQPVPYNPTASEWVDVNAFGTRDAGKRAGAAGPTSTVAPLRYRFNADRGLYEWVQTGPQLGPGLFEGNVSPHGSDWVIAARLESGEPGVAWTRVNDPFKEKGEVTIPKDVRSSRAPLSVYRCADGVTRLCTGDQEVSPHNSNRDPIYIWDIEPDNGFRASNRRQIYSPRECGNPIPEDHGPLADMIKLLPHAGGSTQTLIHRVRTCAMAVKEADYTSRIRPLTEGDFTGTAIYHAKVHYSESYPGAWDFA